MIKNITIAIIAASIAACVLPLISLNFPMTFQGISQGFYWQIITYFLIAPLFSLSLIAHLVLNLFFLHLVGGALIKEKGQKIFLMLFVGGVLLGGIAGAGTLTLTHSPNALFGFTPPLYALLATFALLYPRMELFLFAVIPLKAKPLFTVFLAVHCILDLANGNMTSLAANGAAIAYGFLVGSYLLKEKKRPSLIGKVYDIKTGRVILRDEEFMNACLDKIAKYGKSSLTFIERIKLKRISARQRRRRAQP